MVKAVDIQAALAGRPVLRERGSETSSEEVSAAFATLAPYRDGALFAGSFEGQSEWERHRRGDELVQILAGAATLTILTDGERHEVELRAGMLAVVPQGCWHRFDAPDGVTVMTATPQPTDHSSAEDPRAED